MTDTAGKTDPDQGLRRVVGPFGASCVVIGAIIGVGIFFTPSEVAHLAGSSSMAIMHDDVPPSWSGSSIDITSIIA